MGYLNELRDDVTKRLEALDAQSREDVQAFLNFIANAVLESYRNGQKSCAKKRAAAGEKRQSGARAKKRA
jgi:hypothetical protein